MIQVQPRGDKKLEIFDILQKHMQHFHSFHLLLHPTSSTPLIISSYRLTFNFTSYELPEYPLVNKHSAAPFGSNCGVNRFFPTVPALCPQVPRDLKAQNVEKSYWLDLDHTIYEWMIWINLVTHCKVTKLGVLNTELSIPRSTFSPVAFTGLTLSSSIAPAAKYPP